MDLGTFTLNPLTLALLILGIVEFIKKFGLTGNKLMLVSMGVGVLFGVVYKFHEVYPPLEQYIEIAFFGIAAGLCASGIYSFVNNRFPPQTKATIKYTRIMRGNISDDPNKEIN
jgi:prepilin signal peptidase PulO-like enzyme (type II secretory pathway)